MKIFFVPDSNIQINNSFGKIVLKSFNDGEDNMNSDFGDTMSISNGMIDDDFQSFQNNDFGSGFPFESVPFANKIPNFEMQPNITSSGNANNRRSMNDFNGMAQQQMPVKRATSMYSAGRNPFSTTVNSSANISRQMRQETESKVNENNKENIAEETKTRQAPPQQVHHIQLINLSDVEF